ncbi:putative ankyrin repeat protein RF_0381 [Haliotis rubra]|uniref:putative ankyrin repeat protein RF_0381 n=1 Tax=Haliotis rubra TaxID=36100 RepID=UPI001EE53662|nr:putative ankyrin repeat protein RF_0381 [Haliotis rubra]
MTPVMHAAKAGHREVFDLLVREGANLSLVDHRNRNILFFACFGGNVEIVRYVLEQNIASINSRDMDRQTPAMNAALYKRQDVFYLLVEAGADLLLVDDFKQTILHVACQGGNVEIVKAILTHHTVDINSRAMSGWTPVMYAVSDGQKDVFDVLVEEGADLSQVSNDKESILHMACGGGNVEIVKYLLTLSVLDIDNRDIYGRTPVMHAVSKGRKGAFDVLVEAGADLSLITNGAETLLHSACGGGNVGILQYLLKHGVVDIDSQDVDGWTPVMHAVNAGHKDALAFLVEQGADLLLVNNDKETILHVGTVEIIKYLLKLGIVDIDSRDINGWTPVMRAASVGEKDVFDVLVEAGADLSQVGNNKETILHVSCKKRNC